MGGEEDYIPIAIHCHHQNDSCIKMRAAMRAILMFQMEVMDKVTGQCPQTTTFLKKKVPKRYRTEVLPLTNLTPYR